MNIFLVGSRGSGKSTVGPIIAKRLKLGYIDLDARIVEEAGRSIREIFAAEGEAGFRKREREACVKLKKVKDQVISLGGGALTDPETLSLVKRMGKFVWLRAGRCVVGQSQQGPSYDLQPPESHFDGRLGRTRSHPVSTGTAL
ncbi:MAG: shikimate kinase [Planctomycetes bacterium]|nr:shikimate kinase [Planctomycetota bacterium]